MKDYLRKLPYTRILEWIIPLVLLCSGMTLMLFGTLMQWVGSAFIMSSFGMFYAYVGAYKLFEWSKLKKYSLSNNAPDYLVVLILLLLNVLMFSKFYYLQPLIETDHYVNLMMTMNLESMIFEKGRLWGWTHERFYGLPVGYFYPFGAFFWILTVHYSLLKLLPLEISYTIAVGLMYTFGGFTVYLLGKKYFSRTIGFIAALLVITDKGGFDAGGWFWSIYVGVWPVYLSISLVLLSLYFVEDVIKGESHNRLPIGIFGVLMGLSILCHPLSIVFYGIFLPVCLLCMMVFDNALLTKNTFGRLFWGCTIGIFIGALWLVPFVYFNKFTKIPNIMWHAFYWLSQDIFFRAKLTFMGRYYTVLGLLGCSLLLCSKKTFHFVFGIIPFVFLIVGSKTLLLNLHLFDYLPLLKNILYTRFAMLLRPFWILGMSYVIVIIFQRCKQHLSEFAEFDKRHFQTHYLKMYLQIFIILFMLGLFIGPLGIEISKSYYHRKLPKANIAQIKFADREMEDVANFIERKRAVDSRFFRVLSVKLPSDYEFTKRMHTLNIPLIFKGSEPGNFFIYRRFAFYNRILKLLNIRYVVSGKKLENPKFQFINTFNDVHVYEFREWQHKPYTVINGKANINMRKFENEEILFEVGSGATGHLLIHNSYFPRWTATRNGESIRIHPNVIKDKYNNALLSVDLSNGPGEYRLYFKIGYAERCAVFVFVLGVILAFFSIFPNVKRMQIRQNKK